MTERPPVTNDNNPPSGCAFRPRCPLAIERCRMEVPPLVPMADGRVVACHVRAPGTGMPVQPAAFG
ncbi:oligopeptide/dipeptide ABC transporter ATP-binding protein [Rhizobium mongolense]